VACQNRKGAVDLLGQDDAGEFVRHGKGRERDSLFGLGTNFIREAFRVATKKNQLSRAAVAQIAQPARKLVRGVLFARSVQQYNRCSGIDLQFPKAGRSGVLQLDHFRFHIMADAADVVIKKRVNFRAPRLAEHNQTNFHDVVASEKVRSDEPVFFALLKQSLAADAQNIRGASDFVVRPFQGQLDGLALEIFQRTQHSCKSVLVSNRA
jgi:hypothetical protein